MTWNLLTDHPHSGVVFEMMNLIEFLPSTDIDLIGNMV
jgi:hypothetical protein